MDDVTSNECPFSPDDPFQWNYMFKWTSVMLFICFTVSKLSNRYKSQKRQKRQPLLHFILICKKKVKGFSEIIKINKKINKKKRSRHKNYSWIIIIEYTFLDSEIDKQWITVEHPF